MLLLEHDAKTLMAARGVPVPDGTWLAEGAEPALPCVLKAQLPAGGRGKAGGIRIVRDRAEAKRARREVAALEIGGHRVAGLRAEALVTGARELYLGFAIDAARRAVRVMVSPEGGVDVETAGRAAMSVVHASPEPAALERACAQAAAGLPAPERAVLASAAPVLARCFLDLEAQLLEINPLFAHDDGSWVAGDVRLTCDENALPRQPAMAALIAARPGVYAGACFKMAHGYDFAVIDPDGEIGLVTTGAGLSMKIIDEMTARGARPWNFCDIRSGQMRGDPARLVEILRRMAAAPGLRVVLVNIFAGVTDLDEFAALLLAARAEVPELTLPMVVRLVGNGQVAAEARLGAAGLALEPDLDRALALAAQIARPQAQPHA